MLPLVILLSAVSVILILVIVKMCRSFAKEKASLRKRVMERDKDVQKALDDKRKRLNEELERYREMEEILGSEVASRNYALAKVRELVKQSDWKVLQLMMLDPYNGPDNCEVMD